MKDITIIEKNNKQYLIENQKIYMRDLKKEERINPFKAKILYSTNNINDYLKLEVVKIFTKKTQVMKFKKRKRYSRKIGIKKNTYIVKTGDN